MMNTPTPSAVILVSGGLDSATVLAMARAAGRQCYALSIDYGQQHRAELDAARAVAKQLNAHEHRIVHIDMGQFGGSALTDASIEVPVSPTTGIPSTYVPARNTVMLSIALGWAEVLGAREIHCGVNAVDYSGYPDCRPAFIAAFKDLANLATRAGVEGQEIDICAPLIAMSKAEIIDAGAGLGVDYAITLSCYQTDDAARACGRCDACRLRSEGFKAAKRRDPTRYQHDGASGS